MILKPVFSLPPSLPPSLLPFPSLPYSPPTPPPPSPEDYPTILPPLLILSKTPLDVHVHMQKKKKKCVPILTNREKKNKKVKKTRIKRKRKKNPQVICMPHTLFTTLKTLHLDFQKRGKKEEGRKSTQTSRNQTQTKCHSQKELSK